MLAELLEHGLVVATGVAVALPRVDGEAPGGEPKRGDGLGEGAVRVAFPRAELDEDPGCEQLGGDERERDVRMPARHVGEPCRQLEGQRVVGDREGAWRPVRARRLVVGHRREASGGFATLGGCSWPGGGRCSTSRAGGASDAGRLPRDYAEWIRRYDTLTAADLDAIAKAQALLPERPLLSVILPVGARRP